jgi:2-oxoglutarate dehydrogenase E1 component
MLCSTELAVSSLKQGFFCFSWQVNGHFNATLDPLGLDKRPMYPELDPANYGFSEADLDRE